MLDQVNKNEHVLHAEIARLNKIIQALMDRAESCASIQGSDFNLFQAAIILEDQVRRRTDELEAALRENEKTTRALRESENHNRLLVENSPLCIHEIDLGGRIVSMNRAGLSMLGLKQECEVQGLSYLNAVCDADRERIGTLLAQAYAGETSHFEFNASGSSGKIYKSCFVPIKNKNSGIEKLMGITEDITEHNKADELLRNSFAEIEDLYNHAPCGYHSLDKDGIIIRLNDTELAWLGYTRDEVIGKIQWLDIISPASQQTFRINFPRLKQQGFVRDLEIEIIRKNGTILIGLLNSTAIYDASGNFVKSRSTVYDITERKNAERALQKSEGKLREQKEFLASILESALDAFMLMDTKGVITEWSGKAEKMFGWKREEAVGRLMHETIAPARYREAHAHGMRNFLSTGAGPVLNTRIEMSALHRDGHEFPAELSISSIQTADSLVFSAFIRDISEHKRLEMQLVEREALFRAIFNQASSGIELIDPETLRFVEANPAACRMLGYTHEEFLELRLPDTQADLDEEALVAAVRQVDASGGMTMENRHRCKNGNILDVEIFARMLDLPNKHLLVGVWQDITQRKRAEKDLRITASVFSNSQEGIVITDADNTFVDVNPAFTQITGYTREEVIGKNPNVLSSGRQDKAFYAAMWQSLEQKKAWRGEVWNRRKSGEIYAELLSISAICDDDGRVQRYVGVFSDISYLKAHEIELSQVANYDALTCIPNRRLLADRLDQAIARTQRGGKMLSVCYIDLDGFKQVNDQYGHEAGDQLLVEVTRRLQDALRAGDTVARLGGDEFVVLFNDLASEQECLQILDRILDIVAKPIPIGSHEAAVSASIGVTFYTSANEDGDTLLRQADQAMYVAKQTGKSRYSLYGSKHG